MKLPQIHFYKKITYAALLIASVSCIKKPEPLFNTEIYCPQLHYRFLILKSTQAEVAKSIQDAVEYRQKNSTKKSKYKYTVLYFPNNKSTSISNFAPEQLSSCQLIERLRKEGEL